MTLEAIFASLHMLAILTAVVFMSSQAALCRTEWMNAAVVRRLARLAVIYVGALLVLLLTGVVRLVWGIKGWDWYVSQPLFHWKMLLFVVMAALAVWPSIQLRKWHQALEATGALPAEDAVRAVRRWIMVQAHIMPVIAVIAVFWVRGM